MSFKLYVYYSALGGGWAAFAGWFLGRLFEPAGEFAAALLQGLLLGAFLAAGVGLVDGFWNRPGRPGELAAQAAAAGLGGCAGGLVFGFGELLAGGTGWGFLGVALRVLSGTLIGLTAGGLIGLYDWASCRRQRQDSRGAARKVRNGLLGGCLGGLIGGGLQALVKAGLEQSLGLGRDSWSPSAGGFVALGLSIGLLTGLAQVLRRQAWVRVEAGGREGQAVLLSRAETAIGSSATCDLVVAGDAGVQGRHARIVSAEGRYLVADAGTRAGTFVNGQRITETQPLRTGDRIRLGNCVLRFEQRPS
jgi:hypothetical protein